MGLSDTPLTQHGALLPHFSLIYLMWVPACSTVLVTDDGPVEGWAHVLLLLVCVIVALNM